MKDSGRLAAVALASGGGDEVAADDAEAPQIVELASVGAGTVGRASRRWIGVLMATSAALTGLGFMAHGFAPAIRPAAQEASEAQPPASPTSRGGDADAGSGGVAPDAGDSDMIVLAPQDGATVTSGVILTGGVVAVNAVARRPLGTVHASVSIGTLVLGSSEVEVMRAGPFGLEVRVFPPPFNAPVVLRLHADSPGAGGTVDTARSFQLDIPSAVGLWAMSPSGRVDARGRVQIVVRGYGPLSARMLHVAVRDRHGRRVSRARARLGVNVGAPGAAAGWILGLGRFTATLWLPPGPAKDLVLVATWRDAATGARLHTETRLPADATRLPTDRGAVGVASKRVGARRRAS